MLFCIKTETEMQSKFFLVKFTFHLKWPKKGESKYQFMIYDQKKNIESSEYAEIFFQALSCRSCINSLQCTGPHNAQKRIHHYDNVQLDTHTCRGWYYQLGQRCLSRGWGASRGNSPAPLGTRNHSDCHWGFDGCRWQH